MIKRIVDLAIHPKWIIPIIPHGKVLKATSVIINDGKIIDVLPTIDSEKQYEPKECVNLQEHVLLPGFVNAHAHSAMYLFKGYGDDNELMDWLRMLSDQRDYAIEHYIWPMEEMFVTPQFIEDGLRLACAEMLRSGTTCFNDMYYYPEESAAITAEVGIRAVIALMGRDKNGTLNTSRSILETTTHPYPNIHYSMGPHSPYLYSEQALQEIGELCKERGVMMHIHVQETEDELRNSVAGNRTGRNCHKSNQKCSPIANLARIGALEGTCCAHCVHVLDSDIDLLRDYHASVVHCPHSNLKLGSGIAPVQKMIDRGVNVCLGTDGASSNNNLDMLSEMRTAAMIGPLAANNDARAVSALTALEMATINGARALHLEKEIGSIEIGKRADLVAINMRCIESYPLNNLFSSIVYATGRDQITHTWVDGKCLLNNRHLTTLDVESLLKKAQEWKTTLCTSNPFADKGSPDPCLSPF